MAKRHPFKKTKPGEPIPVTARQLESFMLEHNSRFNSRDYDKFERMELTESPVRDVNDAIVQMFFIGKWRVHKLSLWAEPEDIDHYGNDSNKTFYHLVNR